jgi:hypothetical protein
MNLMSYYEEGPGHSLVRRESLPSAHPWLAAFYELLSRSATLAYFKLNVPFLYGDGDARLMARLLAELASHWRAKFDNAPFAVVLWPGMGALGPVLAEYLDFYQVPYLDYGAMPIEQYVRGRATLDPSDGHPTAEVHALLARQLVEDLDLKRPKW